MITLFIIFILAFISMGLTGIWLLFTSLYFWAVDGWLDTEIFVPGLAMTFVFSIPFIIRFCP
jgi:hypothetical protein